MSLRRLDYQKKHELGDRKHKLCRGNSLQTNKVKFLGDIKLKRQARSLNNACVVQNCSPFHSLQRRDRSLIREECSGEQVTMVGPDASVAVWKALWKARKRRGEQEARGSRQVIPAMDDFAISDVVVIDDHKAAFWLFTDALTGKLLRKATGHVAMDAMRARCAAAHMRADNSNRKYVAEVLYTGCETTRKISTRSDDWADLEDTARAVVALGVEGSNRFKHQWCRQVRYAYQDIGNELWAPVKSSVLKKRLDTAANNLVRAIESGSRRRLDSLETVWVLDQHSRSSVVERVDGVVVEARAAIPRLERALSVKFLHVSKHFIDCHVPEQTTTQDVASMQSSPNRKFHSGCPGGFCDWQESTGKHQMIARSAIAAACREARSGEALDFWPRSLILWCLERAPLDSLQGKWPADVTWVTPKVALAFPKRGSVFAPSQTVRVTWLWRGPAAKFVSIDLRLVFQRDDNPNDVIADELILPHRQVISSVSGDGHFDWEIPVDVNGSCSSVDWQLTVSEVEPVVPGYPLTMASSEVFRVDKRKSPIREVAVPSRQWLQQVSSALAAETTIELPAQDTLVKRWDRVTVCSVCAEVYAELSQYRTIQLDNYYRNLDITATTTKCLSQKQAQACSRLSRPLVGRRAVDVNSAMISASRKSTLPALAPKYRESAVLCNEPQSKAKQKKDRGQLEHVLSWATVEGVDDDDDEEPSGEEQRVGMSVQEPRYVTPQEHKPVRRRKRYGYLGNLHSWQRLINDQIELQDDVRAGNSIALKYHDSLADEYPFKLPTLSHDQARGDTCESLPQHPIEDSNAISFTHYDVAQHHISNCPSQPS